MQFYKKSQHYSTVSQNVFVTFLPQGQSSRMIRKKNGGMTELYL
jgi:hypothetical protein